MLNIIISIYALMQLKMMIFNENDNDNSFESKTDYIQMGPVTIDDGEHMPMYWFKYRDVTGVELKELEQYFTLHFTQID